MNHLPSVRSSRLELWGGHECTVNRIGERFADQSIRARHRDRPADFSLFASLGVRRLRYPVLWEQVSPGDPMVRDFGASDDALAHMRALDIAPIVGLVHHGSGPAYTDLLDPGFASGLAGHAREVAERYDWVRDWTPVNEPLTTARFSALYGHWYPHLRDERAFWLALLNQIDATRLAMRAVRRINRAARLVQTEDLGHNYATAPLADQARFYNDRRWATWDLLCGDVLPDHPLWPRLAAMGFGDRLRRIADDPCPPDIVGINHYLTSDRFLDHRVDGYPTSAIGHSGDLPLADVEAVRVIAGHDGGMETALREAWARYRLPIALTEVHNGCTRDEQMRWMLDAWTTAQALRREGHDIRAVTAWSLLGAYDWNSLLTRDANAYECGVYDLRGGAPRATAMVPLLRSLAAGATPDHPVLAQPGWWRRDVRLLYPEQAVELAAPLAAEMAVPAYVGFAPPSLVAAPMIADLSWSKPDRAVRPLLITGATGTLGRAFAAACVLRAIPHILSDRTMLSLDDPGSIDRVLGAAMPWAVINSAGWVRVDDAEADPAGCMRANRDGSLALAAACAARDIPYITFSSDLVFDGATGEAYAEGDATGPLSVYGHSKAEADRVLLAMGGDRALIIRTAAFFSPHDPHNFAAHVVAALRAGTPVRASADCVISPTFVPDLVHAVLDLVIDGETGLWHVVNDGGASWADFGVEIARAAHLDTRLIEAVAASAMGWAARRPAHAALTSSRGQLLPSLDDAIGRFAAAVGTRRTASTPSRSGRI